MTSPTDEHLKVFDRAMLEFPAENGLNTMLHLSISTWAEILREMEPRALVELLSGSYDDLATARIRRFG